MITASLADRMRLMETECDLRLERVLEFAAEIQAPSITIPEEMPEEAAMDWAKDSDVEDFQRLFHAAKKHLERRLTDRDWMDARFDRIFGRPEETEEGP
jgi:hypothetical protein